MASAPRLVGLPQAGVWRVGWATDPMRTRQSRPLDLADSEAGNRFDAINAEFEVGYFGTSRTACYAETLAHRRPKASLVQLIEDSNEWVDRMAPGHVEAEWRRKRLLLQVKSKYRKKTYLDLHDSRTIAWLNREFRSALAICGIDELGLSHITGGDRQVTRFLGTWLYRVRDERDQYAFDGIRYLSRHGTNLECWAIFDRTDIEPVAETTIEVNDPELQAVARLFDLTIH